MLFGLQDEELLSDLCIIASAVLRKGWGDRQEQPIDQNARLANRRRVPADVIQLALEKEETDTSDGQGDSSTDSEDSSTDQDAPSPLADDLEQYQLMKTAYAKVGDDFTVQSDWLVGGFDKL